MAFITVSNVVALVSCPWETAKKPVLLKAYTEMLRPKGVPY